MIFLDNCLTKVINAGQTFEPSLQNMEIKCFVPVNGGATVKAKSKLGDDHAINGVYTNAGFSRLPGEMVYGSFSGLEVTAGTVYAYYTQSYEKL